MNIINKLTLKHLLLNKKRTIVSIIGIILSTAMMVGIGLLLSTARESMVREVIDAQGSHHAVIENVDSSKLSIIKENRNVEHFNYYSGLGFAKYEESENFWKPYFYLVEADESYFDALHLVEGRFPQNDQEIVLSDHIFQQGNFPYKVGDTITLAYGDRMIPEESLGLNDSYVEEEQLVVRGKETYRIVGMVERSFYESYSSPGFYLFTKIDSVHSSKVGVILTFRDPKKAEEITTMLAKNMGNDVSSDVHYNDALLSMYGASSYDNLNSFFSSFLLLFLSILSVACVIVIYNSFAISVMERKKQFGLLASVGATKKQIRRTVFYEATLVGVIGIILGVLGAYLGIYVVTLILDELLKSIFTGGFRLATYPEFVMIPILFIIAVVYISAYLPARRASRISPIEVIRQNDDIKINKRKIKTRGFVRKLFGLEGEIALKNMKRNKKKYRITIVSLFISIVTFIAFFTYLEYGRATVGDYTGDVSFDITISSYRDSKDEMEQILAHEDVDSYLKMRLQFANSDGIPIHYFTDSYLKENKWDNNASGISMGIDIALLDDENYRAYQKKLNITDDQPILYHNKVTLSYANDGRRILKTPIFKENKNFQIHLSNYDMNDQPSTYYTLKDFHFTDQLPSMLEGYISDLIIFVNKDTYQEILSKSNNVDSYQAFICASKQEALDKLADTFSRVDGFFYSNISKGLQLQRNMILAIEILFYGLLTLITLIGVTSVLNTISTSMNLRRKEFAVLRSVGLSPKGFFRMICFESLFFGLKSLFYGLPVGIFLSYLISRNMNALVENSFHLPILAIMICVVGVFLIVILAMWYSTSRLKKENILDSIRDENI